MRLSFGNSPKEGVQESGQKECRAQTESGEGAGKKAQEKCKTCTENMPTPQEYADKNAETEQKEGGKLGMP